MSTSSMHEDMRVADVIKRERARLGHSQRELSRLLDASPAYVRRIECGDIIPSLPMYKKLVSILGRSLLEVFTEK